MQMVLWLGVILAACALSYVTQFAGATLLIGRALSESDSGRGFSGERLRYTTEPIDDESTAYEVALNPVVDAACVWVTVVWKQNGNSCISLDLI
jgi:hypothetical protein